MNTAPWRPSATAFPSSGRSDGTSGCLRRASSTAEMHPTTYTATAMQMQAIQTTMLPAGRFSCKHQLQPVCKALFRHQDRIVAGRLDAITMCNNVLLLHMHSPHRASYYDCWRPCCTALSAIAFTRVMLMSRSRHALHRAGPVALPKRCRKKCATYKQRAHGILYRSC